MPYLQLDVPARYPVAVKRELARRMGALYAEIMETSASLVDVCFRELGEGNLWQCGEEPVPAAVLSCHIRRGRPPTQRERLAAALVAAITEALQWDPTVLTVEFVQHAGDELYKTVRVDGVLHGGLGRDWSQAEASAPLIETMTAELRTRA